MDFTEGFFTPHPDDTVLSSEITLENHIHFAYRNGESHVHWILRCRNESSADDNNFVIPVLPIFDKDENSRGASGRDDDFEPAIRIRWGVRNINYFQHNLYWSVTDQVLSYERLLTNLGNDLRNYNLDLAEMEFVDVGRSMRVRNQRTLINYYDVAISHRTHNLVWSLLPKQRQPNSDRSDRNISAPHLSPEITPVQVSSAPVPSSTPAPALRGMMVPQIPMAPTVAPIRRLSPVIQQPALPQVPAHSWQPVGESSRMGAAGYFGLPSLVPTMRSNLRPRRNTSAPGHSPVIRPTLAAVGPTSTTSPAPASSRTREDTSRDTCTASTYSPQLPQAPHPANPVPQDTSSPAPPGSPPTLPPPPATHPAFTTSTLSSTTFPSSPPLGSPITPPAFAPTRSAPLVASPTLLPSPTASPATSSNSTASHPALPTTPGTSPTHPIGFLDCIPTLPAHLKIPPGLATPLPSSLTPLSPPVAPLFASSSQSTSPSPPGQVPTPTRSLRPRVSDSSKSDRPSTSKEKTKFPTASGNRRSTREIKRPVRYAESTLPTPVTLKSSGNNKRLTDFKASTDSNKRVCPLGNAGLTDSIQPIFIISDDDDEDGNYDTGNYQDKDEDLDEDKDISSVTCDDSDDDDFEMTDPTDEESGEGDSDPGWQYERHEDDCAEEVEEEDEDDLDPQPATKRRMAAPPSKATHKRAKLAIPTTSSSTGQRPPGENPCKRITRDTYLVSTVTQPLQAILETAGGSLATNDGFLPAHNPLPVAER